MKKDMPLEGLRWSRDSGSALYDTPQTAVLGRAGGGYTFQLLTVNSVNPAALLVSLKASLTASLLAPLKR